MVSSQKRQQSACHAEEAERLFALMGADVLLAKKITYGLGGVVPLMQYISGRKYEQLAEQCGEEDEQGVVPLRLLRNRDMMAAISQGIQRSNALCESCWDFLAKVRSSSSLSVSRVAFILQVIQWSIPLCASGCDFLQCCLLHPA